MKKIIYFFSLLFITLFIFNSKPYNSYSGSKYYLSNNGKLIKKDNLNFFYFDNNSILSKKEKKCIEKLNNKFNIIILD